MRRLWSIVAGLALIGATVGVASAPACARCSCAQVTAARSFDAADLVFVGVITNEDRSYVGGSSLDPVLLTFRVDSVEKGSAGPTVVVKTASDEGSCGWGYSANRVYRVYVRNGETNLCAGNKEVGPAPDVVMTHKGAGSRTNVFLGLVAGTAPVVAAVAGYLAWRRRTQDSA
jgi:hypothetical protein